MEVKQIIVIRKDLKMRRGKEIAQGAHASMAWLTERVRMALREGKPPHFSEEELAWVEGRFTKVVVRVESEEELYDLMQKCHDHNLTARLIVDAGFTEFRGVPTKTALGIGPHEARKLTGVTSGLKLY